MTNLVDVKRITNEMMPIIPMVYNENIVEIIEPIDTLQLKLFKIFTRKQLHTFGTCCHYKKNRREYKYEFPFNAYNQENSTFDSRDLYLET